MKSLVAASLIIGNEIGVGGRIMIRLGFMADRFTIDSLASLCIDWQLN